MKDTIQNKAVGKPPSFKNNAAIFLRTGEAVAEQAVIEPKKEEKPPYDLTKLTWHERVALKKRGLI